MKNNIILLHKEGLLHEAEFGFIQQPFFDLISARRCSPHSPARSGGASGR